LAAQTQKKGRRKKRQLGDETDMSSLNSDPNQSTSDVFINATKTAMGGIKIDFNVVLDLKKPEKKSDNERSSFRTLISDQRSNENRVSDKRKNKKRETTEDAAVENHRKRKPKILFGQLSSEELARFACFRQFRFEVNYY
jgi:hypothetical protein